MFHLALHNIDGKRTDGIKDVIRVVLIRSACRLAIVDDGGYVVRRYMSSGALGIWGCTRLCGRLEIGWEVCCWIWKFEVVSWHFGYMLKDELPGSIC